MTVVAKEDSAIVGADGQTGVVAAMQRAPLDSWLTLALLFFFCILANFDQRIMVMLVEPIKADFKLTDVQMAWLLGPAFAVAFSLFQIPLGWASDKYPRRLVIYLGVTAWSLATMACAFTNSFWALLFARAFVGVGEASLGPAAYSLIVDKFPRRRLSLALSIYSFALKIGTAIAMGLGGVIIAVAAILALRKLPLLDRMEPWQMVFIMVGGVGIVVALLALAIHEPARPARTKAHDDDLKASRGFGDFLKENIKLVATLGAAFGLTYMTVGALLSWVPTYMTRHYGWTPIQYGPVMGLMSFISVGILFAKGLAVDWLFVRGWKDIYVRFYTWLLVCSIPLVPIAFIQQNPVVFLVLLGVIQSVALGAPMFLAITSQSISPTHLRGRMSASLLVVTGLMTGVGPLLPAAITDLVFKDESRIGSSMCIVATVALVLALILFRVSLRWVGPIIIKHAIDPAAAQAGGGAHH
ncbi:MAG: permease of the major facilitator superfamily [Caulobacteraceae bacterium]|nr:permease of the major facilitator superfamily [Caulobacteraceae bacterium]